MLISHAHLQYVRDNGPMSLEQFKEFLGRSLQARHLDLARADIIQVLDELDARASITFHPMSPSWEFHFIRLGD